MKVRKWLVIPGVMIVMSSAAADDNISIRPMGNGRWLIEDSSGRDLGTARQTSDSTILIEDMNGRDKGTIRSQNIDLSECGKDRSSLDCLLQDEDDE